MEKLIEQLKRHEGFRAKPYKCSAGKWTIGYGMNLDSLGISPENLIVNESFAEYTLGRDLDFIDSRLICFSDFLGLRTDSRTRYMALMNMTFNLGFRGLSKFEKMIDAIDNEDYEEASTQMLDSKWARQVGSRATELAEQMRTGEWQQ